MENVTIKEKLTLMREGYSLIDINNYINESSKTIGDIFLESTISDINFITESTIEFMVENDNVDAAKNRLKKMLDWLMNKMQQIMTWIKEKFASKFKKVHKEDIKEEKFEDVSREETIHEKLVNGQFDPGKYMKNLQDLTDDFIMNKKYMEYTDAELKNLMLKKLLDTNTIYNIDSDYITDTILGPKKKYTIDKKFVSEQKNNFEKISGELSTFETEYPKFYLKLKSEVDRIHSYINSGSGGFDNSEFLLYKAKALGIIQNLASTTAMTFMVALNYVMIFVDKDPQYDDVREHIKNSKK
jgi:hypothetical protein